MSTHTLRELARDYSRGVIDKEKYRKSRSELIKGIIAGQIAVKPIDYLPLLKPPVEEVTTKTIERDRTQIREEPSQSAAKPKKKPPVKAATIPEKKSAWPFIIISTSVVLILIIAVVLFYPKPPTATTETIVQTGNANTIKGNNVGKAGEDLIAKFLTEKDWSEESLDSFIASWTSLSDLEKNSAAQTKRMQRMSSSIYKQFLEEKALASIDSEKAIMKQQKLIEFANAIGIRDSRLVIE